MTGHSVYLRNHFFSLRYSVPMMVNLMVHFVDIIFGNLSGEIDVMAVDLLLKLGRCEADII